MQKLNIKQDLPGKLKFDWNSTSHQSGTEELHAEIGYISIHNDQ